MMGSQFLSIALLAVRTGGRAGLMTRSIGAVEMCTSAVSFQDRKSQQLRLLIAELVCGTFERGGPDTRRTTAAVMKS